MTPIVVRLKTHLLEIPLVRPFVTAVRRTQQLTTVVVEAIDSDGRSGWGEAVANWRVTGESPASIEAAVHGPLSAVVLGREVSDLTICDVQAGAIIQNAAARSAVDCAIHDLAAQILGLPLHVMLSGARQERDSGLLDHESDRVATDMTLSAGSRDDLLRVALEHRRHGFHTLKVKVGTGADDAAALAEVRTAVGPDIRLRVDANQAWDAHQAIDTIRFWEDAGVDVELVEQPVGARAIEELAYVTAHVSTPILADESVWTLADLTEIIRRRAASMVNIKLAKTGGLIEARRMASYASAHQVDVLVGCMMESQVGIASAAALAASLGTADVVHDLDAGLWLAGSVVQGGARYDGDCVVLAAAPGTGITGLAPSKGAPRE